jgi:hypothetical protein
LYKHVAVTATVPGGGGALRDLKQGRRRRDFRQPDFMFNGQRKIGIGARASNYRPSSYRALLIYSRFAFTPKQTSGVKPSKQIKSYVIVLLTDNPAHPAKYNYQYPPVFDLSITSA